MASLFMDHSVRISDELPTKRLHVSGITSTIKQADLERLLSSFGKVKAIDGFGARDAFGDPRKFVFVTMEIDAKALKKCLNALSGSTWKGAKLRIGEAKPDFRERLAQVNSLPPPPIRPKRTHARNYGYPSSSLPLNPLSSAAAASTPGWTVTPSGRVVRPMRMRPGRPLEPTRSELSTSNVHRVNGKVKNRIKPPPVRARRRLIDPTNWDSVYLKGVFLDAVSVPLPTLEESSSNMKRDATDEEDEDTDEDTTDISSRPSQSVPQLDQNRAHTVPDPQKSQGASIPNCSQVYETTESIDVPGEVNTALTMLENIFGDRTDWEERASAEEMEGFEGSEARKTEMQVDEEGDIEIVPRDFGESERSAITKAEKGKGKEVVYEETQATRYGDAEMGKAGPPTNTEVSIGTTDSSRTNLKTLFMPREEASFSLLDHLELDLDLELDVNIFGNGILTAASQENSRLPEPILSKPHVAQIPATRSNTKAQSRLTLDTSLPLLFPPADMLPHPHAPTSDLAATARRNGTSSCFLFSSAIRVPGFHHLPPSITFTRTPQDTSESIREMWERDKSSLTHDWKKAWREARGSRRGRVGVEGAGEVPIGY